MTNHAKIGLVSFIQTNGDGTAIVQTWKFSPDGYDMIQNMFTDTFGEPVHELLNTVEKCDDDSTHITFELNVKIS